MVRFLDPEIVEKVDKSYIDSEEKTSSSETSDLLMDEITEQVGE